MIVQDTDLMVDISFPPTLYLIYYSTHARWFCFLFPVELSFLKNKKTFKLKSNLSQIIIKVAGRCCKNWEGVFKWMKTLQQIKLKRVSSIAILEEVNKHRGDKWVKFSSTINLLRLNKSKHINLITSFRDMNLTIYQMKRHTKLVSLGD